MVFVDVFHPTSLFHPWGQRHRGDGHHQGLRELGLRRRHAAPGGRLARHMAGHLRSMLHEGAIEMGK